MPTKAKAKNKKPKGDYDGAYDDVMEGETLSMMRTAIVKFEAGKISKKEYDKVYKTFLGEFPASAIKKLKRDIAYAKKK